MNRIIFSLALLFWGTSYRTSAQAVLDSTNLPIVFIDTYFQAIPDEPKITAGMAIIDNGYNVMNHITDTNYTYYGTIGIEQRGSISQQWWWTQKSYALETWTPALEDTSVSILGMPEESDWVLYGPFTEASLLHNVLTYTLASEMGYWQPRTRYCEVLLKPWFNWNYAGVYVMTEKIKRDNNRVDIAKLDADDNAGDSLTGGYIIAVDQNINVIDSGWYSTHPLNEGVFLTYKYPKGDEITPEQKNYIQNYIGDFETAVASPDFADPETGFRAYIEPQSFMDFFFLQEISKNVDAYKRSSYLYKDKGGKLVANPHWDYNSAYQLGLFGCEPFDADTGWTYDMVCWVNSGFPVPFWWERMLEDTTYANDLKCRWLDLRATSLSNENIQYVIDSVSDYVADGAARHFEEFGIAGSQQSAAQDLSDFVMARLAWMDAHMPGTCYPDFVDEHDDQSRLILYPNPAREMVSVALPLAITGQLTLLDARGAPVFETPFTGDRLSLSVTGFPPGLYLVRVQASHAVWTSHMVIGQ